MKKDITLAIVIIILMSFGIFVLGMITENLTNQRTKYEFYSLDGEKGYSYHCEADNENGARCEIDGNLIKVDQFDEVTE